MKIDELIRQRADELRSAYEQESPRALPLSPQHKSRMNRSGIGVMVAAALAVFLVFGPLAFLLRSDPQTSTEPDDPLVTTDGSIASRLYEQPGDQGLGSIMDSGEDLMVAGYKVVLSSADGGESWRVVGGAPAGEEAVVSAAANGDVLVAIAAHGGTGGGLYRSTDDGGTWELQDLPALPGTVQIAPQTVTHNEAGFVVAGTGTTSTFDDEVTLYLWKSSDGQTWDFEHVADLGAEFIYIESVEAIDDSVVLLTRTGDDFATRLLGFERQREVDVWSQVDLTPIVQSQAGISVEPSNERLIGAGIVDGELLAWWSFDNGLEDTFEKQSAVTRRTAEGEWDANRISGIAPETITTTSDGVLVGTSHPGEMAPYIEPRFTAIVVSTDGISWQEIGRFQGVALGKLKETGPNLFLASGKEVENEGSGRVPSSGIWKVQLTENQP